MLGPIKLLLYQLRLTIDGRRGPVIEVPDGLGLLPPGHVGCTLLVLVSTTFNNQSSFSSQAVKLHYSSTVVLL